MPEEDQLIRCVACGRPATDDQRATEECCEQYEIVILSDGETFSPADKAVLASVRNKDFHDPGELPHQWLLLNRVWLSSVPDMLEALRDVEAAWTGNGDMSVAVDACLLAIAKATT